MMNRYTLTELAFTDLMFLKTVLEAEASKLHKSVVSAKAHGRRGTASRKTEQIERIGAYMAQIDAHLRTHHNIIRAGIGMGPL